MHLQADEATSRAQLNTHRWPIQQLSFRSFESCIRTHTSGNGQVHEVWGPHAQGADALHGSILWTCLRQVAAYKLYFISSQLVTLPGPGLPPLPIRSVQGYWAPPGSDLVQASFYSADHAINGCGGDSTMLVVWRSSYMLPIGDNALREDVAPMEGCAANPNDHQGGLSINGKYCTINFTFGCCPRHPAMSEPVQCRPYGS